MCVDEGNDDLVERLPVDMAAHAPGPLPQRGGYVKHDPHAAVTNVIPTQQPASTPQLLQSQQSKPNNTKS